MEARLFDVNVLIALSLADHVHFEAAHQWWHDHDDDPWATCPITECGLMRALLNPQITGGPIDTLDASRSFTRLMTHRRHTFWPDDLSLARVWRASTIRGYREITDAYLAVLAEHHGGKVLTLDRGMARRHPGLVELIPS